MSKRAWILGAAAVASALVLGFAGGVYSQRRVETGPLGKRLSNASGVSEVTVNKVLKVLGPTIMANLKAGNVEEVEGLGTFRIVRVDEHRDLQNGRPVVVPAENYIVFDPVEGVARQANARGVKAADVVPEFKYTPLPNQTPSQRTPKIRVPSTRTR
jgi:nucleoid DNA-binding protein